MDLSLPEMMARTTRRLKSDERTTNPCLADGITDFAPGDFEVSDQTLPAQIVAEIRRILDSTHRRPVRVPQE